MKKEIQVTDVILCECRSYEHQILISYDKEEQHKAVYISIHLVNRGFFRKLVTGIRYIFGYKCRFGAFDEIILAPEHASKLQAVVDYLKLTSNDK